MGGAGGSFRALASAGLIAALAGCTGAPPLRTLACGAVSAPDIAVSADGKTASTRLSVLTYNIEGLDWPARSGRPVQLRQIGERLAAMRAAGTAPDVVLVQEMFSRAAKKAVRDSGYPAIAPGPSRLTRAPKIKQEPLPGKSKWKHGEVGLRLKGSGLAIASAYPLIETQVRAYSRKACAGFDCLSNKGIMMGRIAIPGVPGAIDIYGTHMNSRGASKAPAVRNLAAHKRQSQEAAEFLAETNDDANPLIFGGDFNMRHSIDRFAAFSHYQPLELVHRICADPKSGCDVRMSWDGDEPWMDTQDLQFFWPGDAVSIRPIRVEAMFDGGPSGPVLSDHDGFMVTYELSWPADSTRPSACTGAGGGRSDG